MSKVVSTSDGMLIRGAEVITVDNSARVGQLDIRISGQRIVEVGAKLKRRRGEEIINAKGLVAMPGMVQCHIHLCQTLFRGAADDLELLDWLRQRVWPLEGASTESDIHASARLGIAELLLGGTTSILDMGTVQHTDALFRAAKSMGIRYTGGKTIMDRGQGYPVGLRETTTEALKESVRLCETWHGTSRGRLRYAFSPRFAVSCTDEAMRGCAQEARRHSALLHTHASENSDEVRLVKERTGLSNIEYLHSVGFTGSDVLLAHCIWVGASERKILRETKTRVVHCPSANLKLASGIARIADYLAEGIHVAVGADGAACNNRLDGFEEMRLTALLHKVRSGPTAIPAHQALRLLTRNGAEALGMKDVGSIAEGFVADIMLLNLEKPHAYPPSADIVSRVVYSARASDVHSVFVGGKRLVHEGELTRVKVGHILRTAKKAAGELLVRAL